MHKVLFSVLFSAFNMKSFLSVSSEHMLEHESATLVKFKHKNYVVRFRKTSSMFLFFGILGSWMTFVCVNHHSTPTSIHLGTFSLCKLCHVVQLRSVKPKPDVPKRRFGKLGSYKRGTSAHFCIPPPHPYPRSQLELSRYCKDKKHAVNYG